MEYSNGTIIHIFHTQQLAVAKINMVSVLTSPQNQLTYPKNVYTDI